MSKLGALLISEKVVTFEFPGCPGLEFDIAYLSKEEVQKLTKKCTRTEYNSRTHTPIDKLDEKLFMKLYVEKIIKGWRGFKLEYLNNFILVNLDDEDMDTELEFSSEDALELMEKSTVFDTWVSEQISDLGKFNSSNTKKSLSSLEDM